MLAPVTKSSVAASGSGVMLALQPEWMESHTPVQRRTRPPSVWTVRYLEMKATAAQHANSTGTQPFDKAGRSVR